MSRSPLWPPCVPLRPHPQLAERQVDVVAHDQQVRRRDLIEVQDLADGSAAQVHERLRLDEEDFLPVLVQLGHLGLEPPLEAAGVRTRRQGIDHVETDVVPRPLVAAARIAQTDDDLHHASEE